MKEDDKVPQLYNTLSDIAQIIPDASLSSVAATLGLLAPQYPFLSVVAATVLLPLSLRVRDVVADRRMCEIVQSLSNNASSLREDVVTSEKFSSFFRSATDLYLKETSEDKMDMLRRCILNVATASWDQTDAHNRVLEVMKLISPSQYLSLIDIAWAIHDAMKWDRVNRGKISFEYGQAVIMANLETRKSELRVKSLLRKKSLDLQLRYLHNLNLVITKDISLPVYGGSSTELQVSHVTPLGHQLIRFVNPEIAKNMIMDNVISKNVVDKEAGE